MTLNYYRISFLDLEPVKDVRFPFLRAMLLVIVFVRSLGVEIIVVVEYFMPILFKVTRTLFAVT